MSEHDNLLESVATTLSDYQGRGVEMTPAHVNRWIEQFGEEVRLPLLREIDHVFKRTYLSESRVRNFFGAQIKNERLVGENPIDFWRKARFLDIQQDGKSQTEIRGLFGELLKDNLDLEIDECGASGNVFVYLDDFLFNGDKIRYDLSAWIEEEAPENAEVYVLVIATHSFGKWKCDTFLQQEAVQAGKSIEFRYRAAKQFENRKSARDMSDVLWPSAVPDDPEVQAYIGDSFKLRKSDGQLRSPVFSSETGRRLLEREMLRAGMRIRSFSRNPSDSLKPLGYYRFKPGFGSTLVTFRNCPNNTPLAFWWGTTDPSSVPLEHPFRKWYPLLPRKPYDSSG